MRYKIKKAGEDRYIIIDRLKVWMTNNRYTNTVFRSIEMAQGYLVGKGKGRWNH